MICQVFIGDGVEQDNSVLPNFTEKLKRTGGDNCINTFSGLESDRTNRAECDGMDTKTQFCTDPGAIQKWSEFKAWNKCIYRALPKMAHEQGCSFLSF